MNTDYSKLEWRGDSPDAGNNANERSYQTSEQEFGVFPGERIRSESSEIRDFISINNNASSDDNSVASFEKVASELAETLSMYRSMCSSAPSKFKSISAKSCPFCRLPYEGEGESLSLHSLLTQSLTHQIPILYFDYLINLFSYSLFTS
jgi:hypothetical protein